ncbi:hypothetical protein IT413_01485 [Candidatus Peregrinibacteria bacterium]|nr:hypothetical protein [Candidatus Peregrinibacteria bacterium]
MMNLEKHKTQINSPKGQITPEPYQNKSDFLKDLSIILKSDYDLVLTQSQLEEAGQHINGLLGTFI